MKVFASLAPSGALSVYVMVAHIPPPGRKIDVPFELYVTDVVLFNKCHDLVHLLP